eukprot:SM000024S07785  [mRNA]  locus=s24:409383:412789:- [translate_table: standard]
MRATASAVQPAAEVLQQLVIPWRVAVLQWSAWEQVGQAGLLKELQQQLQSPNAHELEQEPQQVPCQKHFQRRLPQCGPSALYRQLWQDRPAKELQTMLQSAWKLAELFLAYGVATIRPLVPAGCEDSMGGGGGAVGVGAGERTVGLGGGGEDASEAGGGGGGGGGGAVWTAAAALPPPLLALALASGTSDGAANGRNLTLAHHDGSQNASIEGLDVHISLAALQALAAHLVGLHYDDALALVDLVPLALGPRDDLALGHGRAQRRHEDLANLCLRTIA